MRTAALTLVLLVSGLVSSSIHAAVLRVEVDDMIHPISDEYIGRALDQAAARRADAVLLELRTPGGLETSMRAIVEKIIKSPVPVIVWVGPSGSRAASAGFFILEAADVAAMAP
ncbi:MAG TPA: nodulation protein NfeD, partial [Thermoanaerobaculia bacterium]|nr:nodulation protein NfeD [Thermoanaerobaculia bacterium]